MTRLTPQFLEPQEAPLRPTMDDVEQGKPARVALLNEALAGVSLGARDVRFLGWMAGWDWETVAAFASLVARARAVGAGAR